MASPQKATRRVDWLTALVWTGGGLIYLLMALPVLVVILSAFTPNPYPEFPPSQFSLRWFSAVLSSREWRDAMGNSLLLLLIVTPVTTVLGTLAAYALARLEFRGRDALQAFLLSPLMIPQIVLGVALLYQFTALGWTGGFTGLAIGHILVAFPYVVRTAGVSIFHLDPRLEAASASLGAGPAITFWRVTVPLIRPGIIAGAVFSAITSFGEVSISLLVAGPGATTVPVRIFNYIEQTFDPGVNAISVLFILLAVLGLWIIERTVGLTKVL